MSSFALMLRHFTEQKHEADRLEAIRQKEEGEKKIAAYHQQVRDYFSDRFNVPELIESITNAAKRVAVSTIYCVTKYITITKRSFLSSVLPIYHQPKFVTFKTTWTIQRSFRNSNRPQDWK
jgi:cysteinyl-tRNA synthetase